MRERDLRLLTLWAVGWKGEYFYERVRGEGRM